MGQSDSASFLDFPIFQAGPVLFNVTNYCGAKTASSCYPYKDSYSGNLLSMSVSCVSSMAAAEAIGLALLGSQSYISYDYFSDSACKSKTGFCEDLD